MFYKFVVIFFNLLIQLRCEPDRRIITTLKYSKFYVQPTIVNGSPASIGQVSYMVSIKEPLHQIDFNRIVWKNHCGGSIISELKVLTAAHCFEGNNFYYYKRPDILRVVAGILRNSITHSGNTETNVISQWRKINRVVLHNDFNFPKNDIALVFVDQPWKFTGKIDYVVIAKRDTDYPQTCKSAGYGKVGHGLLDRVSPKLLVARINLLSKWKCSLIWEMNMNTYICTDSALSDVSRGDSGGPLTCINTLDPVEEPNKELLVGVVSGKNFDKTTLYTRVSAYHDWIERNGGSKLFYDCMNLMLNILLFLIYLFFFIKHV